MYSINPILRPPLELSKSDLKDHFWIVPKVGVENEEKNSLNFENNVFR